MRNVSSVMSMSPVPMALTSGVTWRRILPRTSTGSVWAFVPPRNCDVMTSSNEKRQAEEPGDDDRRRQQRQRDAAEDAPAVGAEVGRRLLQSDRSSSRSAPG